MIITIIPEQVNPKQKSNVVLPNTVIPANRRESRNLFTLSLDTDLSIQDSSPQ